MSIDGYRQAVAQVIADGEAALERERHVTACMLKNGYAGCEQCKPRDASVIGFGPFLEDRQEKSK